MDAGYQVWNASGILITDTTDRMGTLLGIVTLTGGVSGSVTNAAFADGAPFWCATPLVTFNTFAPLITPSGTTLSWSWPITGADHILLYGVY